MMRNPRMDGRFFAVVALVGLLFLAACDGDESTPDEETSLRPPVAADVTRESSDATQPDDGIAQSELLDAPFTSQLLLDELTPSWS